MEQKPTSKNSETSFDGLDPEVFEEMLRSALAEYGYSLTKEEDQEPGPSTTPPLRAWLSPIPQRSQDKSKKS